MKREECLQLLGCVDSNLEIIKKAFRKKSKKYHPDFAENGGDIEMFIKIKEAYERLMEDNFEKSDARSPLNNQPRPRNIKKDSPLNLAVTINIDDENAKNVKYKRKLYCKKCLGTKFDIDKILQSGKDYKCKHCNGKGVNIIKKTILHTVVQSKSVCNICDGVKVALCSEIICDECCGKGFTSIENVVVMKKFEDKMHYSELGNHLHPENKPGDLVITFRYTSNMYIIRSLNLIRICNISLHKAQNCEADRYVNIVLNKINNSLEISKGTTINPNDFFIMKGCGLNKDHDLYIIFNVVFSLDDDEKKTDSIIKINDLYYGGNYLEWILSRSI